MMNSSIVSIMLFGRSKSRISEGPQNRRPFGWWHCRLTCIAFRLAICFKFGNLKGNHWELNPVNTVDVTIIRTRIPLFLLSVSMLGLVRLGPGHGLCAKQKIFFVFVTKIFLVKKAVWSYMIELEHYAGAKYFRMNIL